MATSRVIRTAVLTLLVAQTGCNVFMSLDEPVAKVEADASTAVDDASVPDAVVPEEADRRRCPNGDNCDLDCDTGGCEIVCANNSTCTASCHGGGCTMTCNNNASCDFSCHGGDCAFSCSGDCTTSCLGRDCTGGSD